MTTVIDEEVQQRDDDEPEEPEGGRRLLAAYFEGLDLEALGLRYHADGGGFDLTTGPKDAHGLTALLRKARGVLRRLGKRGRTELSAAKHELGALEQRTEERVHRWLVRKVRHLVRYALGRLVQMAARQLRASSEQKKAAKSSRHSARRQKSRAPRSRSQGGAAARAGTPGPRADKNGKGGPHANGSLSPRKARKTVAELPEDQVKRLARGLAPAEVDRVAEQLPVKRAENAAPALHQVEHAAAELVGTGA